MRIDSLTIRRRSSAVPPRAGAVRLVRRRGGVSRILAMIRRTAASSSGVQAVNDLCLSASASDAISPSMASSPCSSSADCSVAGMTSAACDVSALASAFSRRTSARGSSEPRKNRRKTRSYPLISSRLLTRTERPAQYKSTRSAGSSSAIAVA